MSSLRQIEKPGKKVPGKNRSTKPSPLQATLCLKTHSGYGSLTRYSELMSTSDLAMECCIPATASRELSLVVEHLERISSATARTVKTKRSTATLATDSKRCSLLD